MIVLECEVVSEGQSMFRHVFFCDFCGALIKGEGGQAIIPGVHAPAGIAIGARFYADFQVFHLHDGCLPAFIKSRTETTGADFRYAQIALHAYISQILIAVENAVESERKS